MVRYIIAAALALATMASQAQNITLKRSIISGGDTITLKPGQSVRAVIDSINEIRFKEALAREIRKQDSIDEAVENAPSLYYTNFFFDEKGKIRQSHEIERNPSSEFIRAKSDKHDSLKSYSDMNYEVIDSINRLRASMSIPEMEVSFDDFSNFSFVDETIFMISREKKMPMLVKDIYKKCDCACYQYIVEKIMEVEKVRKNLLNPKTKSFNISIVEDKKGIYVNVKYERGIMSATRPVYIED